MNKNPMLWGNVFNDASMGGIYYLIPVIAIYYFIKNRKSDGYIKELISKAEYLETSNKELERFKQVSLNREERVIELKKKVNELSLALGRPAPYDTAVLAME